MSCDLSPPLIITSPLPCWQETQPKGTPDGGIPQTIPHHGSVHLKAHGKFIFLCSCSCCSAFPSLRNTLSALWLKTNRKITTGVLVHTDYVKEIVPSARLPFLAVCLFPSRPHQTPFLLLLCLSGGENRAGGDGN